MQEGDLLWVLEREPDNAWWVAARIGEDGMLLISFSLARSLPFCFRFY